MNRKYSVREFYDVAVPCLSKIVQPADSDERQLIIFPEEENKHGNFMLGKKVMARLDPTGVLFLTKTPLFSGHIERPIPALLWGERDVYDRLFENAPITAETFPKKVFTELMKYGILVPSDNLEKRASLSGSTILAQYSNLPLKAVLEVTAACQCNCELTCYLRNSLDGYMPKTAEIFERVDHIATLGIPIVEVSGGEATLREIGKKPDLASIFERIEMHGLLHYMVSNGEFLSNPKVFDSLLSYLKRGGVAISIDGAGAFHNKVRGREGIFNKVGIALNMLQEENVPRIISATIGPYNIDQLEDILILGVQKDIPVFIRPVADTGNASDKANTTSGKRLWERVNETIESETSYRNYAINAFIFPGSPVNSVHTYGCNAGHKGIRITPRGKVHMCYLDIDEPVGDIMEFNQTILSDKIASFTERKLSNYIPCSTCNLAAYKKKDPRNPGPNACYGPCHYAAIAKNRDWNIKFPNHVSKK